VELPRENDVVEGADDDDGVDEDDDVALAGARYGAGSDEEE